MVDYAAIEAQAAAAGLAVRGGFHALAEDAVPVMPDGSDAATVVLLGNVGPETWRAFSGSPEQGEPGTGLDRWSERVIGGLAERLRASALFPFGGPPFLPFIRWAERAEPVYPSPIGPLIHPVHGLWHAYRGALAFRERLDLPARPPAARPCDTCSDRPCLTTCPVRAFTAEGYDVPACTAHIGSPAGADCMATGCRARRACPVGDGRGYPPEQASHHMRAFLRANG